jgi:hypothetical protein
LEEAEDEVVENEMDVYNNIPQTTLQMEGLDGEESKYSPTDNTRTKALHEYSRQYYRDIMSPVMNVYGLHGRHEGESHSLNTTTAVAEQVQHQILTRPNLSVPVEGEFLYRAQ